MSYGYVVLLAGVFVVTNVSLAIVVGRFIRCGMSEAGELVDSVQTNAGRRTRRSRSYC